MMDSTDGVMSLLWSLRRKLRYGYFRRLALSYTTSPFHFAIFSITLSHAIQARDAPTFAAEAVRPPQ